jgi:cytochrome d ubiquinol oxidase subunit I
MELDPVFLSRLQFAFVISFHIPSFTIGLAAWLATQDGVGQRGLGPGPASL